MKRHQLFVEFLPNTILLGISTSQYEGTEEWHPTWRFAIGIIFLTFSYTKILISEDNSVS